MKNNVMICNRSFYVINNAMLPAFREKLLLRHYSKYLYVEILIHIIVYIETFIVLKHWYILSMILEQEWFIEGMLILDIFWQWSDEKEITFCYLESEVFLLNLTNAAWGKRGSVYTHNVRLSNDSCLFTDDYLSNT